MESTVRALDRGIDFLEVLFAEVLISLFNLETKLLGALLFASED